MSDESTPKHMHLRVRLDPEVHLRLTETRTKVLALVNKCDDAVAELMYSIKAVEHSFEAVPDPEGPITYDDETLFKVRDALEAAGLSENQITQAISEMQNRGILFRERA